MSEPCCTAGVIVLCFIVLMILYYNYNAYENEK